MYTKLKVSYKGADNKGSFKTTLKAVKDSAVSAVVSFARIPVFSALIDSSSLTIINKKDKCFSVQALSEFSKTIGIDLETKINEVTEENVMPSTEPQTEAPKEEVRAEAPKEEAKAEAPKEEAPKAKPAKKEEPKDNQDQKK